METSTPEQIVTVETGGENTCPMCGHSVVTKYRLESEPDSDATCGDCFAGWLVTTDRRVSA